MPLSPTFELITRTSRRRVTLGKGLGRGGAGSVVEINGDPSTVAKIYHESILAKTSVDEERKIRAMIEEVPDLPPIGWQNQLYVQIAWPTAALLRDGKFAGFGMPALEVNRTRELEYLLGDKLAAQLGLRSDMGVRVTVSRQLAGVVAALHAKGHYVVDMKPQNLSYYPDALYMAVLDCDGFNIHDEATGLNYPAPMLTPEYLAPEFQTQGTNPNSDPKAQDKFALAVIVFQLLCHGVHPYDGKLSSQHNLERPVRIAHGYYPYGLASNPACSPSPFCTYQCLPKELLECFERAFVGDPARRPSAQEWVNRLEKYANPQTHNLVSCSVNSKHVRFAGLCCSQCARDSRSVGRLSPRRASQRMSVPLSNKSAASLSRVGSARGRQPGGGPNLVSTSQQRPNALPAATAGTGSAPRLVPSFRRNPKSRSKAALAPNTGSTRVSRPTLSPRSRAKPMGWVAVAVAVVIAVVFLWRGLQSTSNQNGLTPIASARMTDNTALHMQTTSIRPKTPARSAWKSPAGIKSRFAGKDAERSTQNRESVSDAPSLAALTSKPGFRSAAGSETTPAVVPPIDPDRSFIVASRLVANGEDAFNRRDYNTAIRRAEAALSARPDDANAEQLLRKAQNAQQQAMNSISIH